MLETQHMHGPRPQPGPLIAVACAVLLVLGARSASGEATSELEAEASDAADSLVAPGATAEEQAFEEPQESDAEAEAVAPEEDAEDGEDEDDDTDLRERLTERPDKRRPADPFEVELFGRPLTFGGEFDTSLFYLDQMELGGPPDDAGQRRRRRRGEAEPLLESGLTLDAFYSFGDALSLYAEAWSGLEKDVDSDTPSWVSSSYVERGEMWLNSEDVFAEGLGFQLGSLYFGDDRRWWWDTVLDAGRVSWETETFKIQVAAALEVAPRDSDQRFIDAEDEDVSRFLGHLSWVYVEDHSLELFALHQHDASEREAPGQIVDDDREDDSDGDLTWLGARLSGAWDSGSFGLFGYWVDAAYVFGQARSVEFEEIDNGTSWVEETRDQRVRGWGIDVGATWILPYALEPRLTLGYALGSGEPNPDGEVDHSFRQTSLQSNESAFGAARSFPAYGAYLDPELSNLHVVTLGAGISLLDSSSLDLVYHYYRQDEAADFLFDSNLEAKLSGDSTDVGHGVDLILSIRESTWVEPHLVLSGFRTGKAFGPDSGQWHLGVGAGITFVF